MHIIIKSAHYKVMSKNGLDAEKVDRIIESALLEDVGQGDITTSAVCNPGSVSVAEIKAKEEGVAAGIPIAEKVFQKLSPETVFTRLKQDGDRLVPGDVILRIKGPASAVLTGERLSLNILQRLSGIATETSEYVARCRGLKTKILDTRKTVPGLRELDKYAVQAGGGVNHRRGLYDGVMIKDNHIALSGGISNAVDSVRKEYGDKFKIEVETSDISQVGEALKAGADIIMLDNMTLQEMSEAVNLINGKALTEASGGITLGTVREVAETGVDYISVGALTHSPKALDIAMYLV